MNSQSKWLEDLEVIEDQKGELEEKDLQENPGVSQNLERSVDANVTLDTAGLEKTFRVYGRIYERSICFPTNV